MGVGPQAPDARAQVLVDLSWVVALGLSCLAPLPLAPADAAMLSLVALLLLPLRRVPAPLLAVLAAPVLLVGVGVGGSLGPMPSVPGLVGWLILGLCLPLAALPGPTRSLRLLLLAVGLVLALRFQLVADLVPRTPGLGSLLVVGAVVVAAAAHPPRSSRLALGTVAAVGLVHGLRAMPSLTSAPQTATQVAVAARLELLQLHRDRLQERPALGLRGLVARPRDHALARALLPAVGVERLVQVGWQPAQADLEPALRQQVARALERQARGGEALRMLWRGREDAQVAWTYALLARCQGQQEAARLVLGAAIAPPGVARAPGRIELGWVFLTDGERTVELQLDGAVEELRLEVRAQSPDVAPRLALVLDGESVTTLGLPIPAGTLAVPVHLSPGPHRLALRFLNDRDGPEGDRNAWVDRLELLPALGSVDR